MPDSLGARLSRGRTLVITSCGELGHRGSMWPSGRHWVSSSRRRQTGECQDIWSGETLEKSSHRDKRTEGEGTDKELGGESETAKFACHKRGTSAMPETTEKAGTIMRIRK